MKDSDKCTILLQILFVTTCFAIEFDSKFACDFSRDTCNWVNTNTPVQFKRNSGGTIEDGTGPSAGHTDGSETDYYIYLETYGSTNYAELVSPPLGNTCVFACFRFWYHMYGRYVNKTEVGLKHDRHPLFNVSGDRQNKWRCAVVPISGCHDSQIFLRAYESPVGLQSQIAFDDLALAYVDNLQQCADNVCNVNGDDATSTTTASTSGTVKVSTSPIWSSTKLDVITSSTGPTTSPTPTSLYLLGLLAVPFVVLAVGIIYIIKRKRNGKKDTGVNNLSLNNIRPQPNGYSSYPMGDEPGLQEGDEVYDVIQDLRRADEDYITPVGKVDAKKGNSDRTNSIANSTADDIDNQGYIDVIDVAENRKQPGTHNDTNVPRSLPPLPGKNSKAENNPSFQEADYPADGNEDYLHPVVNSQSVDNSKMSTKEENLPRGLEDDDYLNPTKSVVLPSHFGLTKEPGTQLWRENESFYENTKRESSTTI